MNGGANSERVEQNQGPAAAAKVNQAAPPKLPTRPQTESTSSEREEAPATTPTTSAQTPEGYVAVCTVEKKKASDDTKLRGVAKLLGLDENITKDDLKGKIDDLNIVGSNRGGKRSRKFRKRRSIKSRRFKKAIK
jgi:hypothetical protein